MEEKWCRICSLEIKCGVFIFGEEARRSFLHAKIRKYLALSITVDDKLPKMVCKECILKLDGFHKFATMAIRNQEKLTKFALINNNNSSIVDKEPVIKPETKSLLHTYLTRGIIEKEPPPDSEITEVEVRVDPMTILQCCLDEDEDKREHKDQKNHEEENSEKTEDLDDDDDEFHEVSENSSENENCENTCIIYICTICKRSFATEFALQDHMFVHSASYVKRFLNPCNDVEENIVSIHVMDKQGAILLTNKEFDIKSVDTEDEKQCNSLFTCPICGKTVSSNETLRIHLETHRPKGKYGCDICGRVFKTQCNLYRHKEYHEGVQFPCEVCGRVYSTNSTLRAHSITHSDLRPHKCSLCDKTFKRNQDLKFHINQHTGARPYQCPYCPKAFASSGNCFSHRKRMHPVEVERDRERAAKIMR